MKNMWKQVLAMSCVFLLLSGDVAAKRYSGKKSDGEDGGCTFWRNVGLGVGAVGAVAAAPLVLGAAGFTTTGIAAGSLAAKVMSAAAAAGGGGVTAGGVVAGLQSAGVAGFGMASKAVIASVGAVAGGMLGYKADEATCPADKPSCEVIPRSRSPYNYRFP